MRPVLEANRYPDFGPAYPLVFSRDREGSPKEGAQVRFGWDERGLHVFVEMEDSCLVAQNREDEQLHYASGDVFELFIKPLNASYKWEMYATPFANKATLFFPTWPTELSPEEALIKHDYHELEIMVEETPNGWNTHLYIPATQLTALGAGWGDDAEWAIFCGRYNYNTEDLSDPELSMAPSLSTADYHLIDEYAILKLN
jgi:hypothetical protein